MYEEIRILYAILMQFNVFRLEQLEDIQKIMKIEN